MKAGKGNIARAVDRPSPEMRFYLFHGEDESQSRALAARLLDALGGAKVQLSSATVKADPARLADEAGAMSLFGGKRAIWIEPATKDIEEAVDALLNGPPIENPVIAVAGALAASSPLRKAAESSPVALTYASYTPDGDDAVKMVIDLGRRSGLKVSPPVATRIAEAAGNDQAIAAQELQKLALYIDASPQAPKELDHAAIDAVGVDMTDGDFLRLADLALAGELNELTDELAKLPAGGSEAIPVVRSLQRRLLTLAPLRARVERGERIDAVMASQGKSLFWKDKAKIQLMLAKWSAEALATAVDRVGKLERSLIFTPAPDREALGEELVTIARRARSR